VPPQAASPGRRNSTTLIRIGVAVLAVILLFGSATHLAPAIRAGLHDGVRGSWVATAQICTKGKGCSWTGKFVLPSGRVEISRAQYDGQLPAVLHAGTRIPALDTGGSGLVFPVTGSDLWISLLVAIAVSLLGLFWASRPWVAGYLRHRAAQTRLAPPLR
jgi:hypothetical protein